jgi:uncharacterized protein YeaO (DUF488 family)
MRRLTLNDGVTPDYRLPGRFDEHWLLLAPPDKLLGDYYKRGLSWVGYVEQYLAHLNKPEVRQKINELVTRAREEDITLLCIEDTPEHCHRRLIALYCLTIDADLKVDIS